MGTALFEKIFQVVYLVCFVVGSFIRVWYSRKNRQDRRAILSTEGVAVAMLAGLWGIAILLPLLGLFTNWLDFANYGMPVSAGFIGAAIFIFALWLLWRSHADLGRAWSVTTEVKSGQLLVSDGVYRYIRHPMYAAHMLWGIAQALLVWNWISGLASLVIFVPLYFLRVTREEKLMLEQFGDGYKSYMNRTGRIIPRLAK
ncbi:MAG: isoprenylcysteine carboxylmethyltransferase family protein [Chloroflexi bacterium]|nr:isoprenylcysteine carboxylmethyltransferase family protein [Chloroflexota bacterium]